MYIFQYFLLLEETDDSKSGHDERICYELKTRIKSNEVPGLNLGVLRFTSRYRKMADKLNRHYIPDYMRKNRKTEN